MSYRHLVLFLVYDGTPASLVDEAIDELRAVLAAAPGVIDARVERSLDQRKGVVVVEDVTFTGAAAYSLYRASTAHARISALMAGMSDWVVGDYMVSDTTTGQVRRES